jgi:hypothetical protein
VPECRSGENFSPIPQQRSRWASQPLVQRCHDAPGR